MAVKHTAFVRKGHEFAAMDSLQNHTYPYKNTISFMVRGASQEQIDF
jgi:predicted 3-demethylubiquinone-9 3-methyltransferase (glyoxalase superfamily)